MKAKRWIAALLAAVLLAGMLCSCGAENSASAFEKADDIVTFEPPVKGKQIVRIAFAMNMNWAPLVEALNRQFPDKQFIYDFYATAGRSPSLETMRRIIGNNDYDLVVANYWYAPLLGADISDQAFLDSYLQTTLDSLASDGHIYGIPLPTTASGFYYNKQLFAQNGWTVPASAADFIALCRQIKTAGYTPLDCCLKYEEQTLRVLTGMTYDELFLPQEGMNWYADLIAGKATFSQYARPMFQLAQELMDAGVISGDYFTASLTEMRKDFFAGKVAMIGYSSDILGLADSEGCDFDIGLAPYPSVTGKSPCVLYNPAAVLYIPADVKNDSSRFDFCTSVMQYLSTSAGQDALLTGWNGVVSLKDYTGSSVLYDQVGGYIENGAYHASLSFAPTAELKKPLGSLINSAVQAICEGTDVDTAMVQLDAAYAEALRTGAAEPQYETIAQATDDFSVLETSYYIADKMRQATGADIALVPSGGFYCSNMADIPKGAVTSDTRLFYQKGIGDKDFITTYTLTGAQLKTLLEHPILNGTEQTQFIAASGLQVEYAPWHASGSRLVSAVLADGAVLDDAAQYTVAAYAGVIDESLRTATLESFDSLGDPQTFVEAALRADKTITPDIAGRVKLDWDIPAAA